MSRTRIGPDTEVTLQFSIELESGELVDSTRERGPATFRVGDGNLLPGFEQALFGLSAGRRERLRILPEHGFGQHNPANVQRLPRTNFKDMALEPGLVLEFSDPRQGRLPGVVREFDEQWVEVDFNHPLAGKTLWFDVEILDVRPVSDS